jgi:guanine nucleotide-binding protein subunit alpha
MCMGGGSDTDADGQRSREIERLIRQDEKRMSKEVKLLLLGELAPTLHSWSCD